MSEHQEFAYYVVELFDPPFSDIEKYVCVPDCWIRMREVTDQIGLAQYPKERLSDIETLVENRSSLKHWTVSAALVKYGTNSYSDAKQYIAELTRNTSQDELIQTQSNSKIATNTDDITQSLLNEKLPETFKYLNIRSSTSVAPMICQGTATSNNTASTQASLSGLNEGNKMTADEQTKKQTDDIFNNDQYYTKKNHIPSQLLNDTPMTSVLSLNPNNMRDQYNKQLNEYNIQNISREPSVNTDSLKNHYVNEIPLTSVCSFRQKCKVQSNFYHYNKCQCKLDESKAINMNERKSDTNQSCSKNFAQNSSTRKCHSITIEEQNQQELRSNVRYVDKSINTDGIGESPVNKKSSKSVDSTESERTNLGILAMLKEMYQNFGKTLMVIDNIRHEYINDRLYMKELIDILDNCNNEHDLQETSKEEAEEKKQEIRFKKQENLKEKPEKMKVTPNISQQKEVDGPRQEKQKHIDDDTGNKAEGEKIQKKIQSDVIKCNKKSSKWTLRYRKKGVGLVELLPYSDIYVNELRLRNCTRIARDSKTLARLLLPEVFKDKALVTCSFTGKKVFNNGSVTRPGLDEHGRNVLLTFVEEYRLANNWDEQSNSTIMSSIRSKMTEMRKKLYNA